MSLLGMNFVVLMKYFYYILVVLYAFYMVLWITKDEVILLLNASNAGILRVNVREEMTLVFPRAEKTSLLP